MVSISDEGFTVLFEPQNLRADIAFVHGLQGNPYSTWTYADRYVKTAGASQGKQQSQCRKCLFKRIGSKIDTSSHMQRAYYIAWNERGP
ncbi:hypothetical protein F5B21DRAFT_452555 [Xylaria acuta]|nr:hypothetical protein F5B21DRAFT_452555 [Xylaria acuta]